MKLAAILIIVSFLLFATEKDNFQIGGIEGRSLCDNGNCIISPDDFILIQKNLDRNINLNDIACTTDEICHVVTEIKENQFCTAGINVGSIDRCYKWDELIGKVVSNISKELIRLSLLILGLFIIVKLKS